MSTFRYVLAWFYLILGAFNASVAVLIMPSIVMSSAPRAGHPLARFLIDVAMEVFIFVAALVFSMAWWVLRGTELSARRWVIAASLMNVFVSLGIPLLYLYAGGMTSLWPLAKLFAIPAAFGIAGFFAFPRSAGPRELPPSPAGPIQPA